MLRMPPFRYHHPQSVEEAVQAWHDHEGAMYVAGGTDLLPNLKHHLHSPAHLVGLTGLPRAEVHRGEEAWVLDAGLTLHRLATHPQLQAELPPLAEAAGLVAGPQIRRMGTLGGNILLDTRCLYFNQSLFWRKALGYCLKKEGDWCHVIGGPKTCVAVQSSDTVPVLLALDASILLRGAEGQREIKLRDLYHFDGMNHLGIERGELLVQVRIPHPPKGFRGSYRKLRTRGSIDFPQLGLAITGSWEGDRPQSLEIVVGAINPKPKPVRGLEAFLGQPMDSAAIEAIAALVRKQTRPNEAVLGDVSWRRAMAEVFTRSGLETMRRG